MRFFGSRQMLQLAILSGGAILLTLMAGVDAKTMAPMVTAKDASLVIPGQYIVVLDGEKQTSSGDVQTSLADSHQLWLMSLIQERSGSSDPSMVEHRFDIEGLQGYTGKFSDEVLQQIRGRQEVKYVEPDQLMYALDMVGGESRHSHVKNILNKHTRVPISAMPRASRTKNYLHAQQGPAAKDVIKQTGAPWGISRVSHGEMPLDLSKYHYPRSAGKRVDIYVIDTGINIAHVDFGGRAQWGVTIPTGDIDIDGNGHGTHCAGTIASKTYGMAKKAHVIAVKVLRTNGFGTNADVIKGVEWTIKAAQKGASRGRRSVANMSLGGGRSITLESAVNRAVKAGVHFAVAAGNDNEDACDYSPAAAEGPITVGATTNRDQMTFFSNYGPCVDIFAPGMDITSTWIGSRRAINTISGTSMASPHVAGVMALYLGERDHKPADLKKLIIEHANSGLLEEVPADTENRLLSTHRLLESMTSKRI